MIPKPVFYKVRADMEERFHVMAPHYMILSAAISFEVIFLYCNTLDILPECVETLFQFMEPSLELLDYLDNMCYKYGASFPEKYGKNNMEALQTIAATYHVHYL